MSAVADRLFLKRRIVNGVSLVLSGLAALFGLFWLVWILWTTFTKGADAMSLSLFTEMTPPPGQDTGGLLNAIVGSLVISGLAVLLVEQKLTIALDISQRCYVMGHGEVVFHGTPDELRADQYVRKEWLEV